MFHPLPYGYPCTRLRRGAGDWDAPDELALPGVIITALSAASPDTVMFAPSAVDVIPGDRIRDPQGRLWVATAAPVDWVSPFTGDRAGSTVKVASDPLPLLIDLCEVRFPSGWVETETGSTFQHGGVAVQWRDSDTIPCLAVDASGASVTPVAAQDTSARRITVTLPWDVAGPLVGLWLHVNRSQDGSLDGRDLLVASEVPGVVPLGRQVSATIILAPSAP